MRLFASLCPILLLFVGTAAAQDSERCTRGKEEPAYAVGDGGAFRWCDIYPSTAYTRCNCRKQEERERVQEIKDEIQREEAAYHTATSQEERDDYPKASATDESAAIIRARNYIASNQHLARLYASQSGRAATIDRLQSQLRGSSDWQERHEERVRDYESEVAVGKENLARLERERDVQRGSLEPGVSIGLTATRSSGASGSGASTSNGGGRSDGGRGDDGRPSGGGSPAASGGSGYSQAEADAATAAYLARVDALASKARAQRASGDIIGARQTEREVNAWTTPVEKSARVLPGSSSLGQAPTNTYDRTQAATELGVAIGTMIGDLAAQQAYNREQQNKRWKAAQEARKRREARERRERAKRSAEAEDEIIEQALKLAGELDAGRLGRAATSLNYMGALLRDVLPGDSRPIYDEFVAPAQRLYLEASNEDLRKRMSEVIRRGGTAYEVIGAYDASVLHGVRHHSSAGYAGLYFDMASARRLKTLELTYDELATAGREFDFAACYIYLTSNERPDVHAEEYARLFESLPAAERNIVLRAALFRTAEHGPLYVHSAPARDDPADLPDGEYHLTDFSKLVALDQRTRPEVLGAEVSYENFSVGELDPITGLDKGVAYTGLTVLETIRAEANYTWLYPGTTAYRSAANQPYRGLRRGVITKKYFDPDTYGRQRDKRRAHHLTKAGLRTELPESRPNGSGLRRHRSRKSGWYGVVDATGAWVLPAKYLYVGDVTQGSVVTVVTKRNRVKTVKVPTR